MDESSSSMRTTRDEQSIEELRSKKKNNPMVVQKVINNVITSGIKIVEEGTKRKAITTDSEESESEIDGFKEHKDHDVVT
ncbi:hypothetical protein EJD97_002801 [Solanum chilense]|uniref:Uncharacterized protein n=1 Tax=Solanum chilense TaxID=4083 RepID=A0A6N2APN4_SOLCI|nr:hypothetical protein EJD97_002801 [Solanum chilense]